VSAPRRIGFVTSAEHRLLTPDDRMALPWLAARGIDVVPVVWTEALAEDLDGLVLRSTWDYHLRLAEFLAWVDAVESQGIPLWNSPATVRWNVDKAYLRSKEEQTGPSWRRPGQGARVAGPEWAGRGCGERVRRGCSPVGG
jgi:hypothetical protein